MRHLTSNWEHPPVRDPASCSSGPQLSRPQAEEVAEKIHLWRVIGVIGANILYIVLLEPVGFLLCTFLLLCFLFQAYEKGKWVWAIGGAAAASLLMYVIFSRLLQLSLPKGLIQFF
jgi:putative tricarboxylic transport membrane protein